MLIWVIGSMTQWLDDHPGGREIIESNRSKDVTPIFQPRHPSDQLEPQNIPPNVFRVGELDSENASEEEKVELRLKVSKDEEEESDRIERERDAMEERGLGVIVNMRDFEVSYEPSHDLPLQEADLGSRNSQNPCCQKSLWHIMPRRVMMRSVCQVR